MAALSNPVLGFSCAGSKHRHKAATSAKRIYLHCSVGRARITARIGANGGQRGGSPTAATRDRAARRKPDAGFAYGRDPDTRTAPSFLPTWIDRVRIQSEWYLPHLAPSQVASENPLAT